MVEGEGKGGVADGRKHEAMRMEVEIESARACRALSFFPFSTPVRRAAHTPRLTLAIA